MYRVSNSNWQLRWTGATSVVLSGRGVHIHEVLLILVTLLGESCIQWAPIPGNSTIWVKLFTFHYPELYFTLTKRNGGKYGITLCFMVGVWTWLEYKQYGIILFFHGWN